jgi:hypothetical protein
MQTNSSYIPTLSETYIMKIPYFILSGNKQIIDYFSTILLIVIFVTHLTGDIYYKIKWHIFRDRYVL